jgi:osmoprotectant transport system substrate-binding protein
MEGICVMRTHSLPVRLGALAGIATCAALALAACGGSSSSPAASSHSSTASASNPLAGSAPEGTVVVGSANFPEDELLAEIYLLALQGAGVKATPKFSIGAREVYYPEIEKGAITVIPEYNGALLTTSVDTASNAATTAQVDSELDAKLPPTLEILNPSAAQDSDSVTVTEAFAKQHHLTSIAQLKPIAKTMVFGGPPEFQTRGDGLAGLKKDYGLTFGGFDALDESGPITLAALTDGKVQAADVFTTTPQIITDHLVSLADPKFNFAAQNVIPLVYKPGVNSTVTNVLNEISAKLTTTGLLAMDKALILGKDPYAAVAAGWLNQVGIRS